MYTLAPTRRRRTRQLSPFSGSFAPFFTISGASGFEGTPQLMKTDITETESSYEFKVELPGYTKENVSAELKDGYLVISGHTSSTKEEGCGCEDAKEGTQGTCECTTEQPTSEGTNETTASSETTEQSESGEKKAGWLRRERYFGSCRRSYYLGDQIDEDGITAKFENGLLEVSVPKQTQKEEQKKLISIS